MEPAQLKIKGVIGYNGKVPKSLSYTPDGIHIVYPLGSFVVVKNLQTDKEAFLDGHSNEVTCIAVSHDGRYLASGQSHYTGVKADVLVWNLDKALACLAKGEVMIGDKCGHKRLKQHLGKVQDVAFSSDDQFLATLGGQDDNAIVVWDVASGSSICGSPAGPDSCLCVQWVNNRNDRIVSGGNYHVRVWQVDYGAPKLHPMDAKLGQIRRAVISIAITDDDTYAFCGTTTGDVMKVSIERNDILSPKEPDHKVPQLIGVSQHKYAQGAKSIVCVTNPRTGNTNVLVGSGDGKIGMLNSRLNKVAGYETQLMGGITAISKNPKKDHYTVGTNQCNIYNVSPDLISAELLSSCHYGGINDLCFPDMCPELCVTASKGDIRIWNTRTKKEQLRIQVPNLDCLCTQVSPCGKVIISGWDDGKVRAFLPESGKLKFVIPDAHTDRVTALAIGDELYSDRKPWSLVTGGAEGRVRIWRVTQSHQAMVISLKEHRGPVNCIKINARNTECVTASSDGSCIVWDMKKFVRLYALFESNVFESVLYHPDESQMLTCGSNHKISYWDASDGEAIRVIDGSEENMMSCLDINDRGDFFVSGALDKVLKIWHYDNGIAVAKGHGHSGNIKMVKISPDQQSIVSVGSNGEIIFWEMPDLDKIGSTFAL